MNVVRTGPTGGTPVLLLHPVGLDLTYWGAQIAALSRDYDVLACDLPGHGSSPGSPQDWTLQSATDSVLRLVGELGDRGVHVVGLSVGGMLAQSLAVTEPSLIRSLTLIDTAASFSDSARSGMLDRARDVRAGGMQAVLDATIERWFTPSTIRDRPDLVDRVSKTLLADDPSVHAAIWEMIAGLDLVSRLAEIRCPTSVLVGEQDPSSPVAAARELRDGIPGATLTVIPHAAHLSPLEKPETVNGLIHDFLGRAW